MKNKLQLLSFLIAFPLLTQAQWVSQATRLKIPYSGLFDISIASSNTVWAATHDTTSGNDLNDFRGAVWTPVSGTSIPDPLANENGNLHHLQKLS